MPGLGIAQLTRREGVDAVLVTPWRWDGTARTRQERPVPHVPAASASPARAGQASLLDGDDDGALGAAVMGEGGGA